MSLFLSLLFKLFSKLYPPLELDASNIFKKKCDSINKNMGKIVKCWLKTNIGWLSSLRQHCMKNRELYSDITEWAQEHFQKT